MELEKDKRDLKQFDEIFHLLHERAGGFDGKNIVMLLLVQEMVRLMKRLGEPKPVNFKGCDSCQKLIELHW